MLLPNFDESAVRKHQSLELLQVLPLLLATVLLTIGLAMFLSGTRSVGDVVQPVVVVFGGTLVAMLATFPLTQLGQALQGALARGIQGGESPEAMMRAMLKVCDISRRDGLLGVADVRSSSEDVEEACHLIGDAASESSIRFNLDRRLEAERLYSRATTDVFVFTAVFALLTGLLASLVRFHAPIAIETGLSVVLPFVCGASLALLMTILVGRLRSAHVRSQVTTEIAFRAAGLILEDNNVQRLRARLMLSTPLLRSR